ncbi:MULTISPECIES: thioredoxin family protein [Tenacibaculum]|uniref:Thiol reductase thioredoxin n=1 Tax=Tenacibaculum discolor TaxID=361581 RepID=A0A2G1BSH9_9FLAO|nr:thioredoxin family protein [Tenacibaculum discolor]MDP2542359.1 thioredoxin family protein [Tenacibaculum discolor]PHN96884.1 thiol reductase thioredoxin [Tenacibaculum discolor]PHO01848.1 thiol reductase thioredoxin [Rhodobacteraceae bacterium 4F10]RLK07084.1 thiol-disulfide isomerase/thioredoxin [Tenacibaculum discolor]
MKKIVYFFVTLLIVSCASTPKNLATKNENGNLVGIATKKDFQQEPYGSDWFNDFYSYYETDKGTVEKLKPYLKDIKIKGFMGTWCGDSKREIPNFYKILDEAEFDYKNLELVTVNRQKKANGLEEGFNVIRVPTFIFYKDGKEIGRFVEHAIEDSSVEEDFLKILSGQEYKHPYQK